VSAQNVPFKKQESEHIKNIFKAWNENSGNFFYESIASLVMRSPQPERPDGIEKTTF
jgi:hypothetical protein